MPLIGDLREVLNGLLPAVKPNARAQWCAKIAESKKESSVRDIQNLPDNGHLYAAHAYSRSLARDGRRKQIVATEMDQHQMWEAQYYHPRLSRTLITSGGLGTMGFALPRPEIGAKLWRAC